MKKILLFVIIIVCNLHLYSVYHKVGELTTSTQYTEIAIHDNLLFVNDENFGIKIYEINIPSNPAHISTIELNTRIRETVFQNEFAYLLCNNSKLYVVDILDPFSPQIISEYDTAEQGDDFYLNDNFAYIIEDNEKLEIVYIGNPHSPQHVANFTLPNQGISCALTNDIAFIGTYLGLFVYNIANPYELDEIAWFDTGNTSSLSISDNLLYFSCSDGLGVIDFSNSNEIQILSTNEDIHFHDSVVINDILYGASNKKIYAVDITNPNSTMLINDYIPLDVCNKLAVKDDFIFINSCFDGISILDFSESENQYLLNYQDLKSNVIAKSPNEEFMLIYGRAAEGLHFYKMDDPLNPEYLYSHIEQDGCTSFYIDNEICCSNFGSRLYFYDLTNLNNLTILGNPGLNSNYSRCIARKDDLIYIGNGSNEIMIYDISDVSNPYNVVNIDVQSWIFDLTIKDDFLYFVNINGLRIFDLSDPLMPVEVGFWDSNNRAEQFALFDNYAYIADYDGGIKVIEVSEPTNPHLINTMVLNSTSKLDIDPIIRNNKLFISDRVWNEIFVYDLQNPAYPIYLYSYRWDHYSNDLEVFGNYVYSANGRIGTYQNYGLSLLDFSDFMTEINEPLIPYPSSLISNLSNYPNPFNPETTISFSIPEESKVDLSIFNIKGQKIRSLLNDQITAGEYSIVWNGEDASGKKVSSGVYLYKLHINDKTELVKRCLLLK